MKGAGESIEGAQLAGNITETISLKSEEGLEEFWKRM